MPRSYMFTKKEQVLDAAIELTREKRVFCCFGTVTRWAARHDFPPDFQPL